MTDEGNANVLGDEVEIITDDEHVDGSNESKNGCIVKRKIDFSITRENDKVIYSSETFPLNSLLINTIGATIGNCTKSGDEFKLNLNVEEDGSINLQIHAPNNKMNSEIISTLFDAMADENKLNSNVMSFIHMVSTKFGASCNRPSNGGNGWNNFRY